MRGAFVIEAAEKGGFVVQTGAHGGYRTAILFAGSLDECLAFIRSELSNEQPRAAEPV